MVRSLKTRKAYLVKVGNRLISVITARERINAQKWKERIQLTCKHKFKNKYCTKCDISKALYVLSERR
jgi:hypothetical protein